MGEGLKVVFEPNYPTGGGRDTAGGRTRVGRGRGRGYVPGEPNSSEVTDMDWGNEGSFTAGYGRRKRLIGADGIVNMLGSGQTNVSEGRVVHQVNLLEYGTVGILGETTPQKVQAPKRQRKVDGGEMEENLGSTTSETEDRWEQ
jgi:hypothetical protein